MHIMVVQNEIILTFNALNACFKQTIIES